MCLGIPGKITSIEAVDGLDRSGIVAFGSISKRVNLSLVPEALVGNYVIVHVGFAISCMDEEEARRVFDYIEQLDGLAELRQGDALPG